jgi:hypothetical protein
MGLPSNMLRPLVFLTHDSSPQNRNLPFAHSKVYEPKGQMGSQPHPPGAASLQVPLSRQEVSDIRTHRMAGPN